MKAEHQDGGLDDLVREAIGGHNLSFDFQRWKQKHQDRIDAFQSQGKPSEFRTIAIVARSLRMVRTLKIAAAAVILVAVLVVTGDWLRIATPAFGLEEIRRAMKQVEYSHFVLTVEFVDPNAVAAMGRRPEGWESWTSRNPPRRIEKHADGRIFCTEEDTGRVLRYDPANNTVVVEQGEPTSPELLQMSVMDRFAKELEDAEKRGTKLEYGKAVYEGRPMTTITMDYNPPEKMRSVLVMIVDPDTHLMRKLTWEQTLPKKGWKAVASGIADYPASGPTDIYQAGAPRGAKVLISSKAVGGSEPDARTREVIEQFDAARGRLPKQWTLVAVETDENDITGEVTIIYADGPRARWERHSLRSRMPADAIPLPEGIQAVRAWAHSQESYNLGASLFDGTYEYNAEYYAGAWHRHDRRELSGTHTGGGLSGGLHLLGWAVYGRGRLVENAYAAERGLLCIEDRRDANIQEGKVFEAAQRTLYYLDPSRDHLCVRRETYQYRTPPGGEVHRKVSEVDFNPYETPSEPTSVWEVQEYGRFETGQPYAAKTLEVSPQWDGRYAKWVPQGQKRWTRVYIQTNPEFPEGVFDPNHPGWVP